MSKRRKVWEPRAESKPEVLPEWLVVWPARPVFPQFADGAHKVTAKIAWDAWAQVKGAPAFGSCRVVRVVSDEVGK